VGGYRKLSSEFYQQIIGDKTGQTAALTMNKNINAPEAVHLLEKTAGAKVRFIHVVRNPFDNIATMVLRKTKAQYGEHKPKVLSTIYNNMYIISVRRYGFRPVVVHGNTLLIVTNIQEKAVTFLNIMGDKLLLNFGAKFQS